MDNKDKFYEKFSFQNVKSVEECMVIIVAALNLIKRK